MPFGLARSASISVGRWFRQAAASCSKLLSVGWSWNSPGHPAIWGLSWRLADSLLAVGPWGGAVADRVDLRKFLIVTQMLYCLLESAWALALTGEARVRH